MQLEDWLDDLCVRFIINLPPEELQSVERICFQVEEAQWFYEDFIRPLDPSLPSLSLRAFSLRIFQHCPLFSQWSAQHHTTAFAEFLAYKSRVPVRGAILLSEAMDEVVLVKGWKKSANWSFPRGKINKDENDLDCAVREVYEETGFDAREAGLIRDEKDMKYIEITMREQHMRLYVFRGVPKDAHFEPKTRKEISKIEWYKLTDLPTLKKSWQHDGSGTDHAHLNANKFYMVAPFLNPLKKWIAQQRKKESRYSSHLAAPPMVAEDLTAEEEEQDIDGLGARLAATAALGISDLPEVSAVPALDPALHLKEMLNIGARPVVRQTIGQPSHMPQVDAQKSNALLALLRGDQSAGRAAVPRTPLEQMSMAPEIQRSPHVSHVRPPPLKHAQPPPPFHPTSQIQAQAGIHPFFQTSHDPMTQSGPAALAVQSKSQVAPYQRISDPLSVPHGAIHRQQAIVPPASALPKLTNHTKALLDVFKGSTSTPKASSMPPFATSSSNALSQASVSPRPEVPTQNQPDALSLPVTAAPSASKNVGAPNTTSRLAADAALKGHVSSLLSSRQDPDAQKKSLLQLFNQPSIVKAVAAPSVMAPQPPVELAATTAHIPPEKAKSNKDELLLALLRQGKHVEPRKDSEARRPLPREGETAATISGPLNQPEFEVISKTNRHTSRELGRSPLTGHRTLYDPNAPTPVKILARPEESRPQPPRSPRGMKPTSKKTVREKAAVKEQAKPFQPQILRRPQTIEETAPSVPPVQGANRAEKADSIDTAGSAPVSDADATEKVMRSRTTSHGEAQKQKLLSLFGGGLDTTPKVTAVHPGSGIVSPLTASQMVGGSGEAAAPGIEPISTRTSRVGSMVSIISSTGISRPAIIEKRPTGAENKAFLLGYLGRIAAQEK